MSEEKKTIASVTASLIKMLSLDTAKSKHMLALLRRSASSEIDESESMGWLFENTPKEIQGSRGHLSRAEKAIYLTVCIYAVCRKSDNPKQEMVAAMKKAEIKRDRLQSVELSTSFEDLRMPLFLLTKHIVSKGQTFNYVSLALDLYDIQFDQKKVVRKWEREYAMREEIKDEK